MLIEVVDESSRQTCMLACSCSICTLKLMVKVFIYFKVEREVKHKYGIGVETRLRKTIYFLQCENRDKYNANIFSKLVFFVYVMLVFVFRPGALNARGMFEAVRRSVMEGGTRSDGLMTSGRPQRGEIIFLNVSSFMTPVTGSPANRWNSLEINIKLRVERSLVY